MKVRVKTMRELGLLEKDQKYFFSGFVAPMKKYCGKVIDVKKYPEDIGWDYRSSHKGELG